MSQSNKQSTQSQFPAPEHTPAHFKPVADLYALVSGNGHIWAYTPSAKEANEWLSQHPANKLEQYVTVKRFQEAITGDEHHN